MMSKARDKMIAMPASVGAPPCFYILDVYEDGLRFHFSRSAAGRWANILLFSPIGDCLVYHRDRAFPECPKRDAG